MLKGLTLSLLLATGLWGTIAVPAGLAQQASEGDVFAPATGGSGSDSQSPQQTTKPTKKSKLAAQGQKAAVATAPAAGGDVEQRLQQLEEQISDMQVTVGTMESMGKVRSTAGAAPAAGSSDVDVRVGRLEAQMQGLNNQMADLANQMRALESRLQGGGAPLKGQPAVPKQSGALDGKQQGTIAGVLGEQPAAADTGFGQTVVSPGAQDDQGATGATAAGGMTDSMTQPTQPANVRKPQPPALAGQPPSQTADHAQVASIGPPSSDPQTAYDQAYGLVLQQDYNGAEAAFKDYVTRFPQSPLASNASYWLGQSYYARGQYKPAADAFLRGYKTYRTGQKAPDSLLKVAMSLSRLGQKDMACSALTALDGEFPQASVQIKHLAQSERERAGC